MDIVKSATERKRILMAEFGEKYFTNTIDKEIRIEELSGNIDKANALRLVKEAGFEIMIGRDEIVRENESLSSKGGKLWISPDYSKIRIYEKNGFITIK